MSARRLILLLVAINAVVIGAANFTSTYAYASGRPHLPSTTGHPVERDNTATGAMQSLVWDDDNRLIQVIGSGVAQTNQYDATGRRVIRSNATTSTIFASEYFDLGGESAGITSILDNTFAGGVNPLPSVSPGTAYYFHSDHLGSTSVVTTDVGDVQESHEYFADGELWIDREPATPTNGYLFSGKPFDRDTGFYDFGQRFYDPRTSLFLGTDPAFTDAPGGAVGRPMMLASSAYAGQSPLRNIDPDGRDFLWKKQERGGPAFEYVAEINNPGFHGEILSGRAAEVRNQAAGFAELDATRPPEPGVVRYVAGGLVDSAPGIGLGALLAAVGPARALVLVAGGLAKNPHEAGCAAACAVGAEVLGGAKAAGGGAGRLRALGGGEWESAAGLRYGPGSAQGNRVLHVLEHAADNPARAGAHGVFGGGRSSVIGTIDEAYGLARAGGPGVSTVQQGARTVYTVDMGRSVGFVGGQAGAALGNPAASHVRLVLEGTKVITAFPVIP